MTKTKLKKRSLPQRQLYPRKSKQYTPWSYFEKTPENFLYYVKNILGAPQLDIHDPGYRRKLHLKSKDRLVRSSYWNIQFKDLELFFKLDLVFQNFCFVRNSCIFLTVNSFVYEDVFLSYENSWSKNMIDQFSDTFDTGITNYTIQDEKEDNYSLITFLNDKLPMYLKKESEYQEEKLLYVDMLFNYNHQDQHICAGIYDSKSRVFLLLDTDYDDRILGNGLEEDQIIELFKKEFDINFVACPRFKVNLQKLDTTRGNCTQWRFIIAYFFIQEGMQRFFEYYDNDDLITANAIMGNFYKKLNEFTLDDFNNIAAKFLCLQSFKFEKPLEVN